MGAGDYTGISQSLTDSNSLVFTSNETSGGLHPVSEISIGYALHSFFGQPDVANLTALGNPANKNGGMP